MSACARSCQRPPRSRASSSRTPSQTCSESTMTPSRSKTTASIRLTIGPYEPRTRTSGGASTPSSTRRTSQTKNVCVPADNCSRNSHSSHPREPTRSGAPLAPGSVAMPCHMAIGGTPRAKCCASQSCPSASSEIAQPPASRSSSCMAASVDIANPTSGGSSESDTSDPTVSPSFWPPASTVTTAMPVG